MAVQPISSSAPNTAPTSNGFNWLRQFKRPSWRALYVLPWWALILLLMGVVIAIGITTPDKSAAEAVCAISDAQVCAYRQTFDQPSLYADTFGSIVQGVPMTLRVAFGGYIGAIFVGLIVGLIRSDPPKPGHGPIGIAISLVRLAIYQVVTLYVEVLRGIPTLIMLLVAAYIITPELKRFLIQNFNVGHDIRGGSELTAVIGLSLVYGAFMSETFRAGIISIDLGQREAARSLGMTYGQMMRHIVLPQAIRRILPPLGNDLVSMIKDSSLVSVFGLRDITQTAKVISGSNFQIIPTYAITVYLYLILTITASLFAKWIERRVKVQGR